MRPLESASLVLLVVAFLALAVGTAHVGGRRALVGGTVGTMVLQAAIEGARWQLAAAYVFAAVAAVLAVPGGSEPRARGDVARVLRVGAAGLALCVAVLLPVLLPVPSLPAPGGEHPVGTVTFLLEDALGREVSEVPGGNRRLVGQAWYPADASAAGAPRAAFIPDVERTGPALARLVGMPGFFANHLAYALSHSHEGVPFASSLGRAPLIIFSHGFGGVRSASTTTMEALASHGYVVVAVDHTYDAAAVAFPDGSVVTRTWSVPAGASNEEAATLKASWVRIRAADVRLLADVLTGAATAKGPDVLAGHVDAARLGVLGHSLGGATAAEVCRTDARFAACADLDGFVYTEARTPGLEQPFLLVEADLAGAPDAEDLARALQVDAFVASLRGPSCRVHVAGARHADFTDFPMISPLLPYLTRTLAKHGGADSVRGTNEVVRAFFDATLRGDKDGWSRLRAARARFSYSCERVPDGDMSVAASTGRSATRVEVDAGADTALDAGGGPVVTAPLPEAALRSILGCWQLEDRERWAFIRTAQGGARVVRTITSPAGAEAGVDYARRAAIPQDLRYSPAEAKFAFDAAGPIHGLRFVFEVGLDGLEGSWLSSHSPGVGYRWTGSNATLRRCGADAGLAPVP